MTLGIAIMAYNRPDYLAQTLASLAANDLSECEVHLWQDGNACHLTGEPTTDDARIEESVAAWQASGVTGYLHRNGANLCCAAMRYLIMPTMASYYDRFICMDDDLVFSPYAIGHIQTVLRQYASDPRFSSVSPGFKRLCPPGHERAHWDEVIAARGHFWCEAWWRDTWAACWPWYEQYYEMVRGIPYREITEARDTVAQWNGVVGGDATTSGASSDTALQRAILLSGYERLRLVVNRATGIGDEGLHSTPELLAELGGGHQPIPGWADEGGLAAFRLVDLARALEDPEPIYEEGHE